MAKKRIAILGGGLAGLAAALYLSDKNYDIHVFEKENQLGGLVSGKIINNNIYEYGPHFFHTNNPEILEVIKNIAGDILIDFKRTILIKFMGNYFIFPLSIFEVFKKLPKKVVFRAILSFIKHNIIRIFLKPKIENSETLLLGYYGRVLYELFFKNYIYHVWGIYPKDFSPSFAEQRIPKISATLFLNKIISPFRAKFSKRSVKNFVENLDGKLFTTKEGYRGITERVVKVIDNSGCSVHLNSEVLNININGDHARKVLIRNLKDSNNKYWFECDGVLNTLPINKSILMIKPDVLKNVKMSAKQLEFRALVFVGVLIKKPKVLPVSFMYFREHSFNRVYDSSYFGHDTYSPDTTILVAEISSSGKDRWWNEEEYCKKMVIKDLLGENIINREEIMDINVYKYKHGYPIYKLGYEKHLDNLLNYINGINNFKTAGRQGLFQYINGHIAIQMGFSAAEKLIKCV